MVRGRLEIPLEKSGARGFQKNGARGLQKNGARKMGPEVCRKKGPGCHPILLMHEYVNKIICILSYNKTIRTLYRLSFGSKFLSLGYLAALILVIVEVRPH